MESMRLQIGTLTTAHSRLSVYVSVWENPAGVLSGTLHLWCSEISRDRSGYMILNRQEVTRLREFWTKARRRLPVWPRRGSWCSWPTASSSNPPDWPDEMPVIPESFS